MTELGTYWVGETGGPLSIPASPRSRILARLASGFVLAGAEAFSRLIFLAEKLRPGKVAKSPAKAGPKSRLTAEGCDPKKEAEFSSGDGEADEDEADLEDEDEEGEGEEIEEKALLDELAGADESGPRSRSRSDWSGGAEDDAELIRRFLDGDDEAFRRIVIKYQHKVHNLCSRILGDQDEAQDMAQEIFITIHRSLKDFRGEAMLSTWIFRISVNHCKNRIKYLGRRKYYHSVSLDQPQEAEEGEFYHDVEDESPDAEEMLGSQEIQVVVQEAISALDPEHRIVIALRDIQGLSYEEIAEMEGIKVGTVKSRIHRARNELKKKLEGKFKVKRTS